MHPLLIAGFVLNLVVVSSLMGFLWMLVVLGISAFMYFRFGSRDSPKREHIIHMVAFGFVYFMGVVAISRAGQEPFLTVVAIVVEIFAFTYLNFLGTKKF